MCQHWTYHPGLGDLDCRLNYGHDGPCLFLETWEAQAAYLASLTLEESKEKT